MQLSWLPLSNRMHIVTAEWGWWIHDTEALAVCSILTCLSPRCYVPSLSSTFQDDTTAVGFLANWHVMSSWANVAFLALRAIPCQIKQRPSRFNRFLLASMSVTTPQLTLGCPCLQKVQVTDPSDWSTRAKADENSLLFLMAWERLLRGRRISQDQSPSHFNFMVEGIK